MAFPDSPLRVRVKIAPGYSADTPDQWVLQDISDDVRVSAGIEITGGRQNEAAVVDPGSCKLTLDNRSGDYSTVNPYGAYYPGLAKGCPIRVGVVVGQAGYGTNAASGWPAAEIGGAWTLAGSASDWSVSSGTGRSSFASANTSRRAMLGDLAVRDIDASLVFLHPQAITGGPLSYGIVARYADSSNYLILYCELGTAAAITVKIARVYGGVFSSLGSAAAAMGTYVAGTRLKLRVQVDGPNLRARVWKEADPEPVAWDVTTTDEDVTGTGVGLELVRRTGNSNTSPVTMQVDNVDVEAVRFTGSVVEWPVDDDQSGNDAIAPIEAAGPLRRLARRSTPLYSPLRRQLSAQSPTGLWMAEDGSDATSLASALPGGAQANITNVRVGAGDPPPGMSSVVTMIDGTSRIAGAIARYHHTEQGMAGLVLVKLDALPSADGTLIQWYTTGPVARWRVWVRNTTFRLTAYDSDDNTIFNTNTGVYTVNPLAWMAVQLETDVTGGSTAWALNWHQVGDSINFYGNSGTTPGTDPTRIRNWAIGPSVQLANAQIGAIWAGPDTLPFVDASFASASNGYIGELDTERIARLADEEGVPNAIEPGAGERLGAQRVASLIDLLRAAEAAGGGVLYEHGTGLGYRPRAARYDRTVETTLDVAAGHLAAPPRPTDDDQRYLNQVTVTRDGGGSATFQDDEQVAASGVYDTAVALNLESDGVLRDHAAWRAHVAAWPGLRFPTVSIDLRRNPDLIPFVTGARYGARYAIENLPARAGLSADLIAEGYTEYLNAYDWTATLNSSPAGPWTSGLYGPLSGGAEPARRDTALTLINDTIGTGTMAFEILSLDGGAWTTDAADFPLDLDVGGEWMTVSAITGAGPLQDVTVSARAVNGVSKSHSAGLAYVKLARPTYRAL